MQNIFPEVQVPTWHVIGRGEAEGNNMPSRYLHQGENVLHYCLFKLEITVLLPNYIYSHVTYHVTRIFYCLVQFHVVTLLNCSHMAYHMTRQ